MQISCCVECIGIDGNRQEGDRSANVARASFYDCRVEYCTISCVKYNGWPGPVAIWSKRITIWTEVSETFFQIGKWIDLAFEVIRSRTFPRYINFNEFHFLFRLYLFARNNPGAKCFSLLRNGSYEFVAKCQVTYNNENKGIYSVSMEYQPDEPLEKCNPACNDIMCVSRDESFERPYHVHFSQTESVALINCFYMSFSDTKN